jgi:hypothetical protein
MLTREMAIAAAMGLSRCGAAFGKDSAHSVSSGVALLQAEGDSSRIGISIVLDDDRAGWAGTDREWVLSWVCAGRLFQGSAPDPEGAPRPDNRLGGRDVIVQGHVAIKNGKSRLFVGTFPFEAGRPYALVVDGRVTDDPGSTKLYPIKATLPCVDISTQASTGRREGFVRNHCQRSRSALERARPGRTNACPTAIWQRLPPTLIAFPRDSAGRRALRHPVSGTQSRKLRRSSAGQAVASRGPHIQQNP